MPSARPRPDAGPTLGPQRGRIGRPAEVPGGRTARARPTKVTPLNKHELAYRLIRERIEAAVYQPGQRLVIDALARDLNISQVPIREAIRRLQAEGWITYRHNSGPEVANIGLEQWRWTMEALAVLEGYATALAASEMRPPDLDQLRQYVAAMQQAMQAFDSLKFAESNRAFHSVIYARCPNPVLVERISETQAQLDAMRATLFPSVPQRGAESIQEHLELVELLAARASFQKIERYAREHKLHFLDSAVRQFAQWARTRHSRLASPSKASVA